MKLSKRLNSICELVVHEKTVADVGCDHGKVLAKLFLDNKIDFAYACDISAKSVKKAEDLLNEIGVDKARFEIVVTDGLQNINTKTIDLVIIAGMGGLEIIKILTENKVKVNKFILVPHNNSIQLRKYLNKNNYTITNDFVVYDGGKYYNIIEVVIGKQKLSKIELTFGKNNLIVYNNDFVNYLKEEERKTQNLKNKVPFIKKIECLKYLYLINSAKKIIKRNNDDR